MRQIWIATCLATILLVGQAIAADRAHKAEAAESKAEVLEKNAAAEGSKALPSPFEIITKPEAQAVDPVTEKRFLKQTPNRSANTTGKKRPHPIP